MNDYLTHLAARAIAQPTLRPRTRMRFEPVAGAEEAPAVWPERVSPAGAPVTQSETTTGETLAPDVAEVEPPRIETREVVRTEERVRTEPRIEREVQRVVEPRVRTRDRIVREREVVIAHQPGQPPEKVPVPHRFDEEPPRIVVRTPEDDPDEIPRESPPRTALPAGRQPQRSQPAAAAAVVSQRAPDIHVTIGRVEVRAVTPQPSRRAPQRSGAMTLDDYVARRSTRERR